MDLKFKNFLKNSGLKYCFYNVSTKETKSYHHEVYILGTKFIILETLHGFYICNLEGMPVLILDLDNISIEDFVNKLINIKNEIEIKRWDSRLQQFGDVHL